MWTESEGRRRENGIDGVYLARYLFEEGVVGLFGGADFDCAHHLAGGDDYAAEGLGRGRHSSQIWLDPL